MYVCVCHGVTDGAIRQAAQAGACSLAELAQTLRVATCCGKCAEQAQDVLAGREHAQAPAAMTFTRPA
ncbi:MAG TPA: (2Fe-2S)-binding protein [Immundisolibacter sp.]|jgi:bacterioferritin-associated ferredoxin